MNIFCKVGIHFWDKIFIDYIPYNDCRQCIMCSNIEVFVPIIGWMSESESEQYEPE